MFIGKPISVAAAPDASNSERSEAKTSCGRLRRIIPIGKLMRPAETWPPNGVVGLALTAVPEGKTIRCVDREDCATPGREGFNPDPTALGMTIGCVVAAPACFPDAGIRPAG